MRRDRLNIVLKGHVTPDDKRRNDYVYVPFDLPEPATRLHVRYRYSAPMSSDKREGGNVIDIGIFDPRGTDFPGAAGFRGWTGSARQEFTITPTEATPGYTPGPLPAGRYQIILGLYRIWEHGADYQVEIEADLGAPERAFSETETVRGPEQTVSPEGGTLRWLRGDLQSHTFHSDGKGSPAQLVAKARALGLDFLAITDHNNVSHHPYLAALADEDPSAGLASASRAQRRTGQGLLLIPGMETTTFYGHMNIWGTGRWCDFRSRSNADMSAIIQLAHASGGLCSINHPKTNGPPWEYALDLPADAIEVWQGPWPWHNEESLALWERLLQTGRRLPAVGGSDYHCPAGAETGILRLGQPTTWVKAAGRSVPGVLEAVRAGRVSLTAWAEGPRLDLWARVGDTEVEMGEALLLQPGAAAEVKAQVERGAGFTLRLIADGEVAHEEPITSDQTVVHARVAAGLYVRAELVGDAPPELVPDDAPIEIDPRGWRWALSNPIYMRREKMEV
jgi:hypothetical protein